jgi:hypothetical protein
VDVEAGRVAEAPVVFDCLVAKYEAMFDESNEQAD